MSLRLPGALVSDEAVVSMVRGAVSSIEGARLDRPGRIARVLPGRGDAVEWRLEHEKLDAEGATEILERITALAQDAMTEIERRADALGEQGH